MARAMTTIMPPTAVAGIKHVPAHNIGRALDKMELRRLTRVCRYSRPTSSARRCRFSQREKWATYGRPSTRRAARCHVHEIGGRPVRRTAAASMLNPSAGAACGRKIVRCCAEFDARGYNRHIAGNAPPSSRQQLPPDGGDDSISSRLFAREGAPPIVERAASFKNGAGIRCLRRCGVATAVCVP